MICSVCYSVSMMVQIFPRFSLLNPAFINFFTRIKSYFALFQRIDLECSYCSCDLLDLVMQKNDSLFTVISFFFDNKIDDTFSYLYIYI